jgi:hypothetical protein
MEFTTWRNPVETWVRIDQARSTPWTNRRRTSCTLTKIVLKDISIILASPSRTCSRLIKKLSNFRRELGSKIHRPIRCIKFLIRVICRRIGENRGMKTLSVTHLFQESTNNLNLKKDKRSYLTVSPKQTTISLLFTQNLPKLRQTRRPNRRPNAICAQKTKRSMESTNLTSSNKWISTWFQGNLNCLISRLRIKRSLE